ncbi:MAG: SDR family NAD(P)-dependent oxidoreductase [Nitrospiraceae bacterium]|nr:SDR family NAD(P)-dependent oxidoreductase [Nitrospiraceae bacterium]
MEKTVLITGGTGGLGGRLALRLHEEGYNVAINFRNNELEAKRLLKHMGESALAIKGDIGDFESVKAMAGTVFEKWGSLDALVNCAGITRDCLLVKLQPAQWDEVINVNLNGPFNTIKVFLPLLINAGGGHIVNVSSFSGLRGKRGQAAYSASKSALLGLTYGAAAELGKYNIRVNAVLPGYMPTKMGAGAADAMEKAKTDSALGKLSDPSEAASFIAWLLKAECITGQVFSVESRII